MAERDGFGIALLASVPILGASAGFVGSTDGWQDLKTHRRLTAFYQRAENGNIALVAEIDPKPEWGEFVLALGFGRTADEAAHQSLASLYDGFDDSMAKYVDAIIGNLTNERGKLDMLEHDRSSWIGYDCLDDFITVVETFVLEKISWYVSFQVFD